MLDDSLVVSHKHSGVRVLDAGLHNRLLSCHNLQEGPERFMVGVVARSTNSRPFPDIDVEDVPAGFLTFELLIPIAEFGILLGSRLNLTSYFLAQQPGIFLEAGFDLTLVELLDLLLFLDLTLLNLVSQLDQLPLRLGGGDLRYIHDMDARRIYRVVVVGGTAGTCALLVSVGGVVHLSNSQFYDQVTIDQQSYSFTFSQLRLSRGGPHLPQCSQTYTKRRGAKQSSDGNQHKRLGDFKSSHFKSPISINQKL